MGEVVIDEVLKITYHEYLKEFFHECVTTYGGSSYIASIYIEPGEKICKRCGLEYPDHIRMMVRLNG